MKQILAPLAAVVLLSGCIEPIGGSWYRQDGPEVGITDSPGNLVIDIDTIVLYQVEKGRDLPSDVQDIQNILWKINAVRSIPFRSFKFRMFEVPEGFVVEINKLGELDKAGTYELCMFGNRHRLFEHEYSYDEILRWRDRIDGNH